MNTESTGHRSLDELLGGLMPGDNLVWIGDRPDLHDLVETAFLSTGEGPSTLVLLEGANPTSARGKPVDLVDGRPGRDFADPMTLEREIVRSWKHTRSAVGDPRPRHPRASPRHQRH